MPRAAIYVRVSSDGQGDNYSLPTQEAACREYAAAQGYAVAEEHVYREVHTATELYERPALAALREALAAGAFDALVCYDPDRFSRSQIHTALLQDYCERAGVALKFAMFDFESSATGRFLLGARAFAAELELEKLKERTARGLRAKVASGKLHGRARAPWGYRYADAARARLVPDEAVAPFVRELFARADAGASTRALAAWLAGLGLPTPQGGATWYRETVRIILRQPAYVGEARAFLARTVRERGKARSVPVAPDEVVALPPGTIPPLVDRAVWERVQRRLARNKAEATRRNADPESFLLRAGFAFCGICGKALVTGWNIRQGARTPIYLADKESHAGCSPHGKSFKMNARVLDAAVWSRVADYLLDPRRLIADFRRRDAADPAGGALAAVEGLIAEADRRVANLTQAIGAIDDPDTRAPLVADLAATARGRRALEEEREAQRARLAEREREERRRAELIDFWAAHAPDTDALDYAGRRDRLAALGVRVRLFPRGRYQIVTDEHPEGLDGGATMPNRSSSAWHNRAFLVIAEAPAPPPRPRSSATPAARARRPPPPGTPG